MSFFTHLECTHCKTEHDAKQIQNVCRQCGKALYARYDLEKVARAFDQRELMRRTPNLWRYHELLPVNDLSKIISLGEVNTPLLNATKLARRLNLKKLWVKDESRLPTGTFKARGLAMAVTKAHELHVKRLAIPSAGNAAEALSAYAAQAGMEAFIFMPQDAPLSNQLASHMHGAKVFLVDGLISDAGKIVAAGKSICDWFDVSTLKEPYRVEGKKTMGLELAEQLNGELPDAILYPTGGGTGLLGMWKAFEELEAIGWIGKHRPRMIAVQSSGCAPIVKAFEANKIDAEMWSNAQTLAPGIRVPKPFADTLILRAIRESEGTALSVTDDEIVKAIHTFAQIEGIPVCPEGAATLAGLEKLIARKEIHPTDRVVLFNTGTALKHMDLITAPSFPILDPKGLIDFQRLTQPSH
ncbi:threonine synthase [Candidatus Acetothermia bacterium]|nr:threonine synthase [Candidatus Acetothermia bacterium]